MATFKDVLEESKLIQIATDARGLLLQMESSSNWTETLEKGLKQYASTHTKVELLAFKAALHFHVFGVLGVDFFETDLLSVSTLVERVGACDSAQTDYQFTLMPQIEMF